MFYTKQQLLNNLNKHFTKVKEIGENENKLTIQADNFTIESKKIMIANFDKTMVLRYQY